MMAAYTDTPRNFNDIVPYVITDADVAATEIYRNKKCFFYDTCSFRRHANLKDEEIEYLFTYFQRQEGILVITRCTLMELASHSGILNQEYIHFIKKVHGYGINVLVLYEEDIFTVMEVCFGTNATINSYLMWAVRMIKNPVSTIAETLEQDDGLCDAVMKGKNIENSGLYSRFFKAVRGNKKPEDNLGEEILAVCLHILSHIPGEKNGKFCVVTDDKGAGSKIAALFQRTSKQYKGNEIILFSTPKLVQFMYTEGILGNKEHMRAILGAGSSGNIIVLGVRSFDLRMNEIRTSCEELAEMITTPNEIHIVF